MKGHIADKNLAAYRKLTTIAMRYDDLGNAIGVADVDETNRCYFKAAEYRNRAYALREDILYERVDGRVVAGVEWRRIAGFSTYEMNAQGELRRIDSMRHLTPQSKTSSTPVYQLRNEKGKTCRSKGKLLRTTFPELAEQ